ncbi:MAG: hypothetical protein COS35_06555 [Zetaproteobacteria bacterium CG02_land_8_20_14_3_00_50_9]|nr:MAG: hypothetical protein AUJ57_00095 [Zetaproteobacteria bacterium CG1_02_53_45]PIV30498.1 MAG: hypothetical protein COS35_06555 [Zetaproteobacteria bacterium CG02_land_8_20_14_3_00_50_9]
MAPRSKLENLPDNLQEQLNQRLLESHYHGIDEHHAWLMSEVDRLGIELPEPISRSAVGRYSRMRKLEQQSIGESVRQMRAIQQEFGDNPTSFLVNGNNMAQMLAWKRVQAGINGDVEVDEEFLANISLAMSRMAKTAVINDDRERDIREDERKRVAERAAEQMDKTARKAGVSAETIALIRRDVLGMG